MVTKNDIEFNLYHMFQCIGMDRPDNYQELVDFVYDDVCETADPDDWNDSDISIAFRRFIERGSNVR